MKYTLTETGDYGLTLNEPENRGGEEEQTRNNVIGLREVIYDAMLYSGQDGGFVYAEVELRHMQLAFRKGLREERFSPGDSSGLVEEVSGIPQSKWNEYSIILTTIDLATMRKYKEEARLSSLVVREIAREDSSKVDIISYSQLQAFAALFAQRAVCRYAAASTPGGGGNSNNGKSSTAREASFWVEESNLVNANGNMGDRTKRSANSVNATVLAAVKQQKQRAIPARDKQIYYEEIIQAQPPVVARVMISGASRQILIRTIDPTRNVSYDTPLSFGQISQELMIPTSLLQSESTWVARRILTVYKSLILKQHVGPTQLMEAFTFEDKEGDPTPSVHN